MRANAAMCLGNLARLSKKHGDAVVAGGAVSALVRILGEKPKLLSEVDPLHAAKANAVWAIANLTRGSTLSRGDRSHVLAVVKSGAIVPLLEQLKESAEDSLNLIKSSGYSEARLQKRENCLRAIGFIADDFGEALIRCGPHRPS